MARQKAHIAFIPCPKVKANSVVCNNRFTKKSRLYLWPPHFPAENKADSDKKNFSFYQNFQKQLCNKTVQP